MAAHELHPQVGLGAAWTPSACSPYDGAKACRSAAARLAQRLLLARQGLPALWTSCACSSYDGPKACQSATATLEATGTPSQARDASASNAAALPVSYSASASHSSVMDPVSTSASASHSSRSTCALCASASHSSRSTCALHSACAPSIRPSRPFRRASRPFFLQAPSSHSIPAAASPFAASSIDACACVRG